MERTVIEKESEEFIFHDKYYEKIDAPCRMDVLADIETAVVKPGTMLPERKQTVLTTSTTAVLDEDKYPVPTLAVNAARLETGLDEYGRRRISLSWTPDAFRNKEKSMGLVLVSDNRRDGMPGDGFANIRKLAEQLEKLGTKCCDLRRFELPSFVKQAINSSRKLCLRDLLGDGWKCSLIYKSSYTDTHLQDDRIIEVSPDAITVRLAHRNCSFSGHSFLSHSFEIRNDPGLLNRRPDEFVKALQCVMEKNDDVPARRYAESMLNLASSVFSEKDGMLTAEMPVWATKIGYEKELDSARTPCVECRIMPEIDGPAPSIAVRLSEDRKKNLKTNLFAVDPQEKRAVRIEALDDDKLKINNIPVSVRSLGLVELPVIKAPGQAGKNIGDACRKILTIPVKERGCR